MSRRPPRLAATLCWALLAAALALGAWRACLRYAGRPQAPLDDAYITLCYARQWAHGRPFTFQAGDGPSTGATSLLHVWLLTPLAAAAGTREAPLLAGLFALHAALLVLALRAAWRLASQSLPPALAHAAALAALVSAHGVWGFFCGLDTGLACLAALWLWERWTAAATDRGRRWWWRPSLVTVFAALTRPELALMAFGAAAASVAVPAVRARQWRRAATGLAVPAAALGLVMLIPALVTGSVLPSSAWAKTGLGVGLLPSGGAVDLGLRYLVDSLKGVWMGVYPGEGGVGMAGTAEAENEVIWAFPPGALVLALVGALPFPTGPRGLGETGGVLWATGWLAVAMVIPAGWHHHRYLIPLFPVFTLLGFAGIARVAEAFPESWRRGGVRLAAGAWLAFALAGVPRGLTWIGRGAEAYGAHHRVMAERLSAEPGGGPVGATDVGVLAYFSGRRILDFKGLTAPRLAAGGLRGWGSLYDVLKSSPPADRPAVAALHAGREDVNAEQAVRAGALRALWSLPHPRMESELVLYACDWGEPGPAPAVKGWALADELDVAEPGAERRHRHTVRRRSPEMRPYNTLQIRTDSVAGRSVGDGGWVTDGAESFEIGAEAGRPLLLLMRTYAPRGSAVDVSVNGAAAVPVTLAPNSDRFQTVLIAQLDGPPVLARNAVTVRCRWPEAREFASYHYWALQPITSSPSPGSR